MFFLAVSLELPIHKTNFGARRIRGCPTKIKNRLTFRALPHVISAFGLNGGTRYQSWHD
jgi:hypothetical protein